MPRVSSNKQTPRCDYYVPDYLTGLLEDLCLKDIRARIRPVPPSRLEILKIASPSVRTQLRGFGELATSLMHKFLLRNLPSYNPNNEAELRSYRLTRYLKISGLLDQIPAPGTLI